MMCYVVKRSIVIVDRSHCCGVSAKAHYIDFHFLIRPVYVEIILTLCWHLTLPVHYWWLEEENVRREPKTAQYGDKVAGFNPLTSRVAFPVAVNGAFAEWTDKAIKYRRETTPADLIRTVPNTGSPLVVCSLARLSNSTTIKIERYWWKKLVQIYHLNVCTI